MIGTKRIMRCLVVWVAMSIVATPVVAQNQGTSGTNTPSVVARFVPDSIAIGDRFVLEVEVARDIMQMVAFPEFEESTLGGIVEILEEGQIDTIQQEGRQLKLRKTYQLTTFEGGYYSLGRFPMLYVDKNITDTIWSIDSLLLKVSTFEIDTTASTIYDIKGVKSVPLKFGEISGYLMMGLLVLVIIALAVWYVITKRRNLSLLGKPKPVIPPHVIAIKALEAMHSQKLWQRNDHKSYYTLLTDILRTYLSGRYEIHAKEMTTEEIMAEMNKIDSLSKKSYGDLEAILRDADLTKFAKHIPDADSNEMAYTNAYYFVEATKPAQEEDMIGEQQERGGQKA